MSLLQVALCLPCVSLTAMLLRTSVSASIPPASCGARCAVHDPTCSLCTQPHAMPCSGAQPVALHASSQASSQCLLCSNLLHPACHVLQPYSVHFDIMLLWCEVDGRLFCMYCSASCAVECACRSGGQGDSCLLLLVDMQLLPCLFRGPCRCAPSGPGQTAAGLCVCSRGRGHLAPPQSWWVLGGAWPWAGEGIH